MSADPSAPRPDAPDPFADRVKRKAEQKLAAQSRNPGEVWLGLGMAGMIGWSVALPALGGAILGVWVDRRHPGPHSWTLMLLVAGLVLGCANTWRWMTQQRDLISPPQPLPKPPHE